MIGWVGFIVSINYKIVLFRGLRINCSYPLSAAGEERVVEQSDDRVSQPGVHYRQCQHHSSTHPPDLRLGLRWLTLSSASRERG